MKDLCCKFIRSKGDAWAVFPYLHNIFSSYDPRGVCFGYTPIYKAQRRGT